MSDYPATIVILGKQHVTRKPSFGYREALVSVWAEVKPKDGDTRFLWLRAAAIGLCSSVGALAGEDIAEHGYSVIGYGQAVYSYLREQKASMVDVQRAGDAMLLAISEELFPSETEVQDAAGFSGGAAGGSE